MEMLHHRGLLGYVTLNTLVFTDELPQLEANVRRLVEGGVDAVLVQDLGVARLIREICPELAIHASTQMTMTSAESIEVARRLGVERVVLARELSIPEMKKIASSTTMPLEAFVHGALCVAYSGQCLTSESLGGRSANRGQCAQACRLNYELIRDGVPLETGDQKYLLSPQDLAGYELVPELIEAGICSLKIEGRLKTAEYVANVVKHYRHAIDEAMSGRSVRFTEQSRREMELSFSRGFSPGWLEGNDHKRLVPGTSSAKRGYPIGEVVRLRGERLEVQLRSTVQNGDGIVLEGNRVAGEEVGGRIYQIVKAGRFQEGAVDGRLELLFQHGLLKGKEIYPGQKIWLTDDPRLTKRLRATFDVSEPHRKLPLRVHVKVQVGKPIEWSVECQGRETLRLIHPFLPEVAKKHALDQTTLLTQLGRLGGSPYQLEEVKAEIEGNPMVPLSVLGAMRKEMVESLDVAGKRIAVRSMGADDRTGAMLRRVAEAATDTSERDSKAALRVLCRTLDQLHQVLENGIESVYVDFHDIRQYREAIEAARRHGARVSLATLRIFKPGERGLFMAMAKQGADEWLVRNLAALDFAKQHGIPFACDFSLNVTNPLSAQFLKELGAARLTASYDLNRDQLLELVAQTPRRWLEVVIHQHMPMFHMEHCVFCSVLSPGTNKSNCGRPCDRHDVRMKDRIGVEHVLHADIGCRNTLYNGQAQSGAEAVADLMQSGVSDFRIELLRDAPTEEVSKLIHLYRELLDGRMAGSDVWRALRAQNRVGVTRGTLEHARNPMAIL